MKKQYVIILAIVSMFLNFSLSVDAQVVKTKHSLYRKTVRQKTKELTKKGFYAKGAGSIELYVIKALNKEFELDENGVPKNTVIYNSSVDPTYIGAVNNCRAAARAAIAGNIETRVAELVKRSLNSDQISAKSANAINKTITAGKQLIAEKVSLEDLYTFYREIKDENDGKTLIEVEYASCYSKRLAMQQAKEVLKKQMQNETEELHKDLDRIFDLGQE
ncbi:MAG: hypothetical protein JXR78_03740 [Victivallales bacterium]|nr:hypothetical protein [Victivallales bacterium]